MTGPTSCDETAPDQAASLCLFRFDGLGDRAWAFGQMGLARRPLRRLPGAGFVKLMGAGSGEGFTPVPDPGVMAVLATWPDLAAARAVEEAAPYRRLRARAAEAFTLLLTRATLRLRALPRFWASEPAISRRVGADPNVLFKIGVGEVPWLQQVTFSVWPDAAAMAAFARADGPHAEAIRAVRAGGWFAEELYARFAVRAHAGTWGGVDPLAGASPALAAE